MVRARDDVGRSRRAATPCGTNRSESTAQPATARGEPDAATSTRARRAEPEGGGAARPGARVDRHRPRPSRRKQLHRRDDRRRRRRFEPLERRGIAAPREDLEDRRRRDRPARSRARDAAAGRRAGPTAARRAPVRCVRRVPRAGRRHRRRSARSPSRSRPSAGSRRGTLCSPESITDRHVRNGDRGLRDVRREDHRARVRTAPARRLAPRGTSVPKAARAAPAGRTSTRAPGRSARSRARPGETRGRVRPSRASSRADGIGERDAGAYVDADRELAPGHANDRRPAEEAQRPARRRASPTSRRCSGRRGRATPVSRKRQREVGVEAALVELVDDDRAEPVEERIGLQTARSGSLRSPRARASSAENLRSKRTCQPASSPSVQPALRCDPPRRASAQRGGAAARR